jgi:hypothetical protein
MAYTPEIKSWMDANGGEPAFGYLNAATAEKLKGYLSPADMGTAFRSSGTGYVYRKDYLDNKVRTLSAADREKYQPLLGDLTPFSETGLTGYYDKAALDARLGNYVAGDLSKYAGLPEFEGLSAVATIDGQNYYDKATFDKATAGIADKYVTADLSRYSALPEIGALKPVSQIDGQSYYTKTAYDAAMAAMDQYATLSDADVQKYGALTGFGNVKPVTQIDGQNYYGATALKSFFDQYSSLDTAKLGSDALSQKVRQYATDIDGTTYIKTDVANYYSQLGNTLQGSNIGYYSQNIGDYLDLRGTKLSAGNNVTATWKDPKTGETMSFIPYEQVFRLQEMQDNRYGSQGSQTVMADFLDYFTHNQGRIVQLDDASAQRVKEIAAGRFSHIDNPGLGFVLNQKEWDALVKMGPDTRWLNYSSSSDQTLNTGHGTHYTNNLNGAWWMKTKDVWDDLYLSGVDRNAGGLQNTILSKTASPDWIAQSLTDKELFAFASPEENKWGALAYDTYVKKNWAAKLVDVLQPIATVLTFVPGFQAVGAAMNLGMGIGSGNVGQALLGAVGLSGAGNAFASSIGSALKTGEAISGAISGALMGAGTSALTGGDISKGLLGGAVGGAVGATFKNTQFVTGDGAYVPYVNKAIAGGLAGAARSAAVGQDVGKGLISGAALGAMREGFKSTKLSDNKAVDQGFKAAVEGATSSAIYGQDPIMGALLGGAGNVTANIVGGALNASINPAATMVKGTAQERIIDAQQREFGSDYRDVYDDTNAGKQALMLNDQIYADRIDGTRQDTPLDFAEYADKATYNAAQYGTDAPEIPLPNTPVADYLKQLAPSLAGAAASGFVQGAILNAMAPSTQAGQREALDSTRRYSDGAGRYNRFVRGGDLRTGYQSHAVSRARG